MSKGKKLAPEWSYKVDVGAVDKWPLNVEISPQDSERSNLVSRLGILALDECDARVKLNQDSGSQIVHVSGEVKAKIRQNCVVSMEPIEGDIHETFEAWYADAGQAVSLSKARRDKQVEKGRGEMPVLSEQEDPEAIIDGKIDIGELITQYLSLSINPYPHAEGAEYAAAQEALADEAAQEVRKNPFAALKDWKGKQSKGDA